MQSRDVAIAMTIGFTGAMISEAVAIRRGTCGPDEINHVELKRAGRTPRKVKLPIELRERISRYLHQLPFSLHAEDPLFVGTQGGPLSPRVVQLALEQMEDDLGVPRATTPRSLRAGAMLLMRREGLLDYQIAARLGLKSTAGVARVLIENGGYSWMPTP